MDTNLIYQFRAVIEAGTIVRAAEQLNMTPGALSRAMKRLEDELDCKLFTPAGRNILPTKEATLFYASSQDIIHSINNAKNVLNKKVHSVRELKIATFEVFSTHFMAWMIEKQALQIPVTLFEATPGFIEKNILNGFADFGLTYIPELHPELDHLMIGEMPLGVFVSNKSKNKELVLIVNQRLESLVRTAEFSDFTSYLNLYPSFIDSQGQQIANFYTDGLHPNDAGYKVWRDRLIEHLAKVRR